MTGAQLLDFLCSKSGQVGLLDKNVSDSSYRAFMLSCLNLVKADIASRQENWHWRFLEKTSYFATVANQHSYDLPSDIDGLKIITVRQQTDDFKLRYITTHDADLLYPDPASITGNPLRYTLFANAIKLFPVPSSAINMYVRYVKTITDFADSSATTDFTAKWDKVIIDGALVYGYKFDPNLGDWTSQQQLYDAGIARMQRDNEMIIDDLGKTRSHRDRYNRMNADALFPLDE